MEATVEEINTVQRRLKVDIKVENVNQAFANAFKDIQKKAAIKGFRKGKAPLNIIKKVYGENVAYDVADKLIKEYLFAAIEKNQIRPIAQPTIENMGLPKVDELFSFSAIVDIMPALTIKNYKGLAVTCDKGSVKSADVQKELEALQKSHAKTKNADEGAKAQAGQLAHISHIASLDGVAHPSIDLQKTPVEVSSGQLIPELEAALPGMSVGEVKEVTATLGPDFPHKEAAGKTASFQLKLEELQDYVLPSLDDEFAKDLGFETFAQLETMIRERLEGQLTNHRRGQLEQALLGKLVDENAFEVPPTLVESVIEDMIEQMRWRNDDEKNRAKRDETFRKSMRDPAKRRAQNTLILWEIAKLEDIKVEDQDVDAHLEKMFHGQTMEPEKKAALLSQMRQAMSKNIRENLVFEKALTFLIDNAKIKEVEPKGSLLKA